MSINEKTLAPSTAAVAGLQAHKTRAPTLFYLLSFGTPPPSPFRSPRAFATHPWTLYAFGVFTAVISGVGMVSLDLIYGRVWTNAIAVEGASQQTIFDKSNLSAGLIAIVGLVQCIATWLFLTCCAYMLPEPRVEGTFSTDLPCFDLLKSLPQATCSAWACNMPTSPPS